MAVVREAADEGWNETSSKRDTAHAGARAGGACRRVVGRILLQAHTQPHKTEEAEPDLTKLTTR